MLSSWRLRTVVSTLPTGDRKRARKRSRRPFVPHLEILESRHCPTTLTSTDPVNFSQMLDNQSDETLAISPVTNPDGTHNMFFASTSWHGGFDSAQYPPSGANGLFFRYSHDSGQTWSPVA